MRTSTTLTLTGLCLLIISAAGCGGGAADASPSATPVPTGPPTPMPAAGGAVPLPVSDVTIGRDRDRGQVGLRRHQTLAIRLAGNPTTGFVWETRPGTDAMILRQEGPIVYTAAPSTRPTVGGGGDFTVRFTALGTGRTWVRLRYHRPWENGTEPPATTFTVQVIVS